MYVHLVRYKVLLIVYNTS